MAFDDMTDLEIRHNKTIRGYVIRALVKGTQNSLLVRQITNALMHDQIIMTPDISKHLDYLFEAGYITYVDRTVNSYNIYRRDGVIKLTKMGIDLAEGTIEDAGVDV